MDSSLFLIETSLFLYSLIGGEEEVAIQLNEASSRHPTRFLSLLHNYWSDISKRFRNSIIAGVAKHLRYLYGNLQSNTKWEPLEKPEAISLARMILDELEKHPKHWHHNRSASEAIEACADVIKDTQTASRLVFLAIGFESIQEESAFERDSSDLLNSGINMISGRIVEALMTLAHKFQKHSVQYPDLQIPTLNRFAKNDHMAIRALILRDLPYLQYHNSDLGWNLFHRVMQGATGLWETAELCLYYAYNNNFDIVRPLLVSILREGKGKELEVWGRISALAALTNHIDISVLLDDLKNMESINAWRGAASVWTHSENFKKHREECIAGIEAGLKANSPYAIVVAELMGEIFNVKKKDFSIPTKLIQLCFTVFESDKDNNNDRLFGFHEWLNAVSYSDPDRCLAIAEIYLSYVKRSITVFV